jgi:hypothetical protein
MYSLIWRTQEIGAFSRKARRHCSTKQQTTVISVSVNFVLTMVALLRLALVGSLTHILLLPTRFIHERFIEIIPAGIHTHPGGHEGACSQSLLLLLPPAN